MRRLLIFTLSVFLSFSSSLFAQGDVTIDLVVFDSDRLQVLIIADLDFEKVGSAEELFEIRITNNTDKIFNECHLALQITKDGTLLLHSTSEKFKIPANVSNSANNIDLINNNFYLVPGNIETHVKMQQGEFAGDVEDIQKEVLSSGKVPMGIYKLSATIFNDADDIQMDHCEITFLQATNPSYVQNVAPGQPFGGAVEPAVFTEFPVFQWNANGDDYQVVVFEKKEMLESLDDILNSRPNWESERTGSFTMQYPQASGAVPLEYGKSYYWLVRMFVRISSGEQVINSEVWTFILKDPSKQGNDQASISKEEVLSFLKEFFGERGEALADKLAGYKLESIRFNGERMGIQGLYRQLNKYRGKSHEIFDLFISE